MLRKLSVNDIDEIANLFVDTYNSEPWREEWKFETAKKYIGELMENKRFVGFGYELEDTLVGISLCHEKTWMDKREISVDEIFISNNHQGSGYGKNIIAEIEKHCVENDLANIILLTDKRKPAFEFYKQKNFEYQEEVVFLSKTI